MDRRRSLLLALGLFLMTGGVFAGALDQGFVSFDDGAYVTANPRVLDGLSAEGIGWAFQTFRGGMWHPLTWLSHMLDVELFGQNGAGHHGVSLFLHACNSVLLFLWLRRSTGRWGASFCVAALWALHPLRVESVAWASERKDVLSGFFFFATLLAYDFYAARRTWRRYLPVFALMALGLLAKPMLVTLPFVLMLVDVWPRGRGAAPGAPKWRVAEKLPLLALSAGVSLVAVLSQASTPALKGLESLSLPMRLGQAAVAYASYLGKTLWPTDLAAFYPHPATQWDAGAFAVRALFAAALLVAITVVALRRPRSAGCVGWLWFLGMLVPVIGLVQVGGQGMADRYSYLPGVGLTFALVFSAADVLWPRRRPIAVGIVGALLLASAALTRAQVETWADSRTLFEHAIAVTGENSVAQSSLGLVLLQEGDREKARAHFEEALRITPSEPQANHNLGLLLLQEGDTAGAERHLRAAIAAQPTEAEPYTGLGDLMRRTGRYEEALAEYDRAIARNPEFMPAHLNRGIALYQLGRLDEAEAANRRALALDPRSADALNNLGVLAAGRGDRAAALDLFQRALAVDPTRTRTRFRVAGLLMELGRLDEAAAEMDRVAREAPNVPEVQARVRELSERRRPE